MRLRLAVALLAGLSGLIAPGAEAPVGGRYFEIRVVDEATGRGVPLVELRTVHRVRYVTDSSGVVAFHEPGLMGRRVFFHVKSHGYEFPKDGFGYRGKTLGVTPGGSATLRVRRINIAERLYRVTGAGIYRDSVLVGHPVPIREPVLNGLVLGQDSVVNAVYRGKLHWFWGDTNRPGYPLGNFHVPGATSLLPRSGGLDPEKGVDLTYFVDKKGFAKETCRMPGKGPTWINGLVVLRGKDGRERMFAAYAKVRGFLEVYERGLVEFDGEKQRFEKLATFDKNTPARPHGHPFQAGGYVYFGDPFPLVRVRAAPEHLLRLSDYEAFTCLVPGSRLSQARLDRAADGALRYGWKRDTPPVGPREQAKLVQAGTLKREEALLHLQDVETGKPVTAHRGSVCWNAFRGRWVMIATQVGGTSQLGEVWYAEADTRLGPWVYARKIVTHDRYSFYNPKQHRFLDKDGGKTIFFEGTYTSTFSGNPLKTPRYDYNQIVYKLDLSDPRLVLPVPIYELAGTLGTAQRLGAKPGRRRLAFFALDRERRGSLPVYEVRIRKGQRVLKVGGAPSPGARPVFHALPAKAGQRPATTVPLYEYVHSDSGKRAYSTDASLSMAGYARSASPFCLVWRNPMGASLSALDWRRVPDPVD